MIFDMAAVAPKIASVSRILNGSNTLTILDYIYLWQHCAKKLAFCQRNLLGKKHPQNVACC